MINGNELKHIEVMQKPLSNKLFNKLELRFAKIYKVHPLQAMRILSDIYFYTDFFKSSTIDKRMPYHRIKGYLFITYGLNLHAQAVKRWYDRIKAVKRIFQESY